jgi:U3 small nucleolar RNA-associated protein 12
MNFTLERSLKFFLSLYGHKLPALTMDISSDSTLLVTGSADKNIKVCNINNSTLISCTKLM